MKKTIVTSLLLLFCLDAMATRLPLWKRKRNLAFQYLAQNSKLSTPSGIDTLKKASSLGFSKTKIGTWQRAKVSEPLSRLEKCSPQSHGSDSYCLQFNWNLNHSSPLYLSWLFVKDLTFWTIYKKVQDFLLTDLLSSNEKKNFLSLLPNFKEVELKKHEVGMRHWEEMLRNWGFLQSTIRGLGLPDDHDYALVRGPRFAEVARKNKASLKKFYSLWSKGGLHFEKYIESRQRLLKGKVIRLEKFLDHPKFGPVAHELRDILASF